MSQRDIEKLLEKTIGLRIGSIGSLSIKRAINERMKRLGLVDVASYMEIFKKRPAEIHELVEEVVVPETWFFRDHFPFVAMVNHLCANWDRSFGLRILSLPCSTGEEPYSIAMALLQAGIEKDLFWIDAVDVSKRSLERARIGEYTRNSFRSKDLRFRDEFFTRHEKKYAIRKEIRQKVRFVQGNILNIPFIDSLGAYDIIFSRNILIYFDHPVQKRAIANLERILKPGGVLFTGHAEAALFINSLFEPLDFKKAFGVVKRHDHGVWQVPFKPESFLDSVRKKTLDKRISIESRKISNIVTSDSALFDKAQKLADLGDLNNAEAICNRLLEDKGPSAPLFFLMGVIKDSQGKVDKSVDLLRKAVYLDPQHYESLIFLSLLAQRTGDDAGARNYRRRAERIQKDTHRE